MRRRAPSPPLLLAVLVLALDAGCWTGNYLTQQGLGQWRLLRERRRITQVLADPAVPDETKRRLHLAVEARDFGIRRLGLRGGDAYTRFLDTAGRPLAWNVSAAPKDRLAPHLYRFPIAGAIPYLGFFHEADARREESRLRAMDLDTTVREVAGYSTLGITSDPVYSSMLEGGDAAIVEVVLHEMLHGTLYLPGHSEWNESLATYVGFQGAALFFRERGDESAAAEVVAEAASRERRVEAFGRFLEPITRELEALYASPLSRDEKLRRREAVFARARAEYLRLFPPRPGRRPGAFATNPLNNAVIMGHAVYHRSTPEHRRVHERVGGDLARLVDVYRHAVENHDDAIEWLRRY